MLQSVNSISRQVAFANTRLPSGICGGAAARDASDAVAAETASRIFDHDRLLPALNAELAIGRTVPSATRPVMAEAPRAAKRSVAPIVIDFASIRRSALTAVLYSYRCAPTTAPRIGLPFRTGYRQLRRPPDLTCCDKGDGETNYLRPGALGMVAHNALLDVPTSAPNWHVHSRMPGSW
jgi:hypothetical protein